MELIFKGPSERRVLALTIDDVPSSGPEEAGVGTAALLELLEELKIPATLFCIGARVRAHPGMAARALAAGHELGNHMWRDQWSLMLSKEHFIQQLDMTETAIRADLHKAGLTAPPLKWFRPSGGWPTPQMLRWVEERGYRTVLGSIWPFDGLTIPLLSNEKRLELQETFVNRFAHPEGIVVMHDTPEANPLTRETLRTVVPHLQAEGYGFVTLTGLLG